MNELYKLYARPHLDYGDVIYHFPSRTCEFTNKNILPNLMEKLESVQYPAALGVSGNGRGQLAKSYKMTLSWNHSVQEDVVDG